MMRLPSLKNITLPLRLSEAHNGSFPIFATNYWPCIISNICNKICDNPASHILWIDNLVWCLIITLNIRVCLKITDPLKCLGIHPIWPWLKIRGCQWDSRFVHNSVSHHIPSIFGSKTWIRVSHKSYLILSYHFLSCHIISIFLLQCQYWIIHFLANS